MIANAMSAIVKVCGCRPHDGGAGHTGAGVRKPPREETAGGVERLCVRRYGDFGAGRVRPALVERVLRTRIEKVDGLDRATRWAETALSGDWLTSL